MTELLFTALSALKNAFELGTRLREVVKDPQVKPEEVATRVTEIQRLISDGRSALP